MELVDPLGGGLMELLGILFEERVGEARTSFERRDDGTVRYCV